MKVWKEEGKEYERRNKRVIIQIEKGFKRVQAKEIVEKDTGKERFGERKTKMKKERKGNNEQKQLKK